MDHNRNAVTASSVLARVPTQVFFFIGVSRQDAHTMGMIGCGIQLDSHCEYDWKEFTISLDLNNPQVCVFLRTKNIQFSLLPGRNLVARIPILFMQEYVRIYPRILSFLDNHRKNKFLRLGRRAFLDPWDLDSRDSFVLSMSNEEFSFFFISDPRGPPLASEVASRIGRHSPKLYRACPGLPAPDMGSWI